MNIKSLKNKVILLVGKSRYFNPDEFKIQLDFHEIELVHEYKDSVTLIIEGAMMNPYEIELCEKIYEQKVSEFIDIEIFESELIKSIDENSLLMSLKLSNDKTRLRDFLTNIKISNNLFLKLIEMYNWNDKDFFDNDNNRDVTATLISKFYKNIEQNHNIQYSKLGLMHLVMQCKDAKLIRCIANLKPLTKSFLADENDQGYKILIAIVTNDCTPNDVLINLIQNSNSYICELIAMRDNLDENLQKKLLDSNKEDILLALSYCEKLSDEVYKSLILNEKYINNVAMYIKLDEKKYKDFEDLHKIQLAQNSTLAIQMQKDLLSYNQEDINITLAKK